MTWEYNVKADMCTAKGDARGRYTPYSIRRLVIATTVAGTTGEQPWECRGLTSLHFRVGISEGVWGRKGRLTIALQLMGDCSFAGARRRCDH